MYGTGSSLNYRYDIGANSWTTRAPLPTPAYAPASGVLGGEVYLTGGGNPFAQRRNRGQPLKVLGAIPLIHSMDDLIHETIQADKGS